MNCLKINKSEYLEMADGIIDFPNEMIDDISNIIAPCKKFYGDVISHINSDVINPMGNKLNIGIVPTISRYRLENIIDGNSGVRSLSDLLKEKGGLSISYVSNNTYLVIFYISGSVFFYKCIGLDGLTEFVKAIGVHKNEELNIKWIKSLHFFYDFGLEKLTIEEFKLKPVRKQVEYLYYKLDGICSNDDVIWLKELSKDIRYKEMLKNMKISAEVAYSKYNEWFNNKIDEVVDIFYKINKI